MSGVGHGAQQCHYDCSLPVALRPSDSNESSIGNIVIPAVHKSELPGLLGLTALRKNNAILDFATLELHFQGPGRQPLRQHLPAGTETFPLELAPSGHMVLPCCEYERAPQDERSFTDSAVTHGRRL